MFEHELQQAMSLFRLAGPGSPALQGRIKMLHHEYTIRRQYLGAELPKDIQEVGKFLDQMRALGLLKELPFKYELKLTLSEITTLKETNRLPKPASTGHGLKSKKKPKGKKKKKSGGKKRRKNRPHLIYTPMGGQPR
jgi:hypothetical protein